MFKILLICIAVLTAIAGCGSGVKLPKGVIVKGKVLKGGIPLEAPNRAGGSSQIRVLLFPVNAGPQDQRSEAYDLATESGDFSIVYAGYGVEPGKYKLAVLQFLDPNKDGLEGKFDPENTPMEIDVPSDKVGGTIDVGTIDLDMPPKAIGVK